MADIQQYNVTEAHIVKTPGVCGGKPRIIGRRITVQDMYIWYDLMGMSAEEIARNHELTLAQVHAALTYAYEHLDEIRADIEAGDKLVEEFKQKHPDKIKKLPGERHSLLP
jgi:uncharacterized protein (DUF433 family)